MRMKNLRITTNKKRENEIVPELFVAIRNLTSIRRFV